jgi:DNA-binding transcriptional ArsR family regulator
MSEQTLETTEETVFKPAAEYVIEDLETLKVLADPLRLSIVELLRKPGNVKRVAAEIGKPPTKLYYHFNLLEKHDLIKMVDTRIVSGIVEKHYQATARSFRIKRDLLSPGSASFDEGLDVTLAGIFGDARNDLREALVAGVVSTEEDSPRHQQFKMLRSRLRLTPERAEDFYQRLSDLMHEFSEGDDDAPEDPNAKPYSMLLLLHPSSRQSSSSE